MAAAAPAFTWDPKVARGVVDVPTLTPAPGQLGRIVAEEVVDGRVVLRLSNGASLYLTASEPGATAVSLVAGATASGLGDLQPVPCARGGAGEGGAVTLRAR